MDVLIVGCTVVLLWLTPHRDAAAQACCVDGYGIVRWEAPSHTCPDPAMYAAQYGIEERCCETDEVTGYTPEFNYSCLAGVMTVRYRFHPVLLRRLETGCPRIPLGMIVSHNWSHTRHCMSPSLRGGCDPKMWVGNPHTLKVSSSGMAYLENITMRKPLLTRRQMSALTVP